MTTKIAKTKRLFHLSRITFFLLCLFITGLAKAETEPNDSKAQANTLTLNTGMPGTVALSESDWFSVTTPEDGNLNITGTFSSYIYIQVYDNDGTTNLFLNYHSGTVTRTVYGLAAGTYYVRLYNYTATETNTYTITPSLTATGFANDTEDNSTPALANVLPLNGSVTGHVGYYYNNQRDTIDWYAVTVTQDGTLSYTITSENGLYIYAKLYDGDGTTQLAGNYTGSTATFSRGDMAPGVYYILIHAYYPNSEYVPYTLSNTLIPPVSANDPLPNETFSTATPLALNGSTTGHIGYRYNGNVDVYDWYSVNTNADGDLYFTITSDNGQYVYAELFDGDGITNLAGNFTTSTATYHKDGLAPGTYYIRIRTFYSYEYTSYQLSDSLGLPIYANDATPNETYSAATVLPLNDTITGHIGYRYNGNIDAVDWYSVTTNADGRLYWTITVDNGQNVYAELFDGDGTTNLGGSYTTTTATFNANGLAPGMYYIRIKTFYAYQFASYQLSNSLVEPIQANDALPNDIYTTATPLTLNDSTTGHIGYRYNGSVDVYDWYAVTTNADGQLFWTITSHNGQYVYAHLFDGDGITLLAGNYTSTTATFNENGLAAGTYYIRIKTYYGYEFAPYTLSNSLTPALYTNDTEPNGSVATAVPLAVNTTVTGHSGYYYNNLDDTLDFYAITLPVDGKLTWTITSGNGQYVYAQLYDGDGTTYLGGSYTNSTATYTKNNLAAGTYYIRIKTYYNNEFTPYTLTNVLDPMNFAAENSADNAYAISPTLLPANTATTGHINFYYYGVNDTRDWWVMGYDGTGAMTITCELEQNHFDVNYPDIAYAVYTDTAAAPIYSGTWINPTNTLTIPSPPISKYYLRLTQSANTFGAYRLTAAYTENCANNITSTSSQIVPCLGTINYTVSGGLADYTVQLYKDGNPFGAPQTTSSTVSFTNLGIGTYYLQSHSFGASTSCNNLSGNTVFSAPPVPNITPGGPTTFCAGGNVVLTADAASSYLWSTGATTQAITVSASGNYVVTVYNAALCSNTSASTSVTVNPLPPTPTITPNGPLTFCANSNVTLSSSVATGYLWSNASTTQSIVVNTAGTFTVTINDANGCTASSASVTTNTIPLQTYYRDLDGDTYGDLGNTIQDCSPPAGYVSNSTDCNDYDIALHPGATELCNGIDDNCDSQVDEGVLSTFYADADGDGYGDLTVTTQACSAPIGYVSNSTDCDDNNNAVHPGATEICNGIDDNCDGQIDEGCGSYTWYADTDGDTYGDPGNFIVNYNPTPPAGYVADNTDCNDANNSIHPGATEIACNGIDENCNGMADDLGTPSTDPSSITSNAVFDEICLGGNAILTVNGGSLGTGASWQWYSGSCGGTPVGTGSSITVSPSSATNYFVRAEGACGNSACVNLTITVKTSLPAHAVVIPPISGLPAYACPGSSASISIPAVPNASQYIWDGPTGTYFNGNPLNTSPFTSATPNVQITFGTTNSSFYNIGVQAANSCGATLRKIQKVRYKISTPASISGAVNACANSSSTYSIVAVTDATQYLWSITGDASVVGNGTTVTVNFGPAWAGGNLCVAAQTPCFTSPAKCMYISSSATALNAISGTFTACPGSVITYSVPPSAGASYYPWTLPAGASGSSNTNSIVVTFGPSYNTVDDICVTVTSVCGVTSAPKCKTVAPGLPARPNAITGPSNGLCAQTAPYSVNSSLGITYNWTAPGSISGNGTSAITVSYGSFTTGSVCVTASNACGTSAARCITIKGAPNTPVSLTATPATWCANTQGIQFDADMSNTTGAYTLNWTFPNAPTASYVSGGGNSNSLTLDWGTGNGTVIIKASNSCGEGSKAYVANIGCKEAQQVDAGSIAAYPNPTAGMLNVEFNAVEKGNASVSVIDLSGRTILNSSQNVSAGNNTMQLDLTKVAKGAYMISVKSNQFAKQIKIIVE